MGNSCENTYRKRLLYQSWYRGCQETDKILGNFVKENINKFNIQDLQDLEEILKESDADIYNWASGKKPLPTRYSQQHLIQQIVKGKNNNCS